MPTYAPNETLGAILVRYGMVTQEALDATLLEQRSGGGRLGELLVRKGLITEEMLVWCLANQLNLPCMASLEVQPERVDREALKSTSASFAWEHHIIPVLLVGDELSVVTDDPLARGPLQELEQQSRLRLNVAIAAPSLVRSALEALYGQAPDAQSSGSWREPPKPDATRIPVLEQVLRHALHQSFRRLRIEDREEGGHVLIHTGEGWEEADSRAELPSAHALLSGLLAATGAGPMTGPQLCKLRLNGLQGTVAFAPLRSGLSAVVGLDAQAGFPGMPVKWRDALAGHFSQPGLHLFGVSDHAWWKQLEAGLRSCFSPSARVYTLGDLYRNLQADQPGLAFSDLEAMLALQPEALILPGRARQAVKERLQEGALDCGIVLQVGFTELERILTVMRGVGITDLELAASLRSITGVKREDGLGEPVPVLRMVTLEDSARSLLEAGVGSLDVIDACSGGGVPAVELQLEYWQGRY